MGFFGSSGGSSGSGSSGPDQQHIFREEVGPSSYPTGGFEIDLSQALSSVNFLDLVVKKGSRGSLPAVDYNFILDSPDPGKVTVKLLRKRYDRTSTVGDVSGEPASVTVQAASGVVSSSESAHVHTLDHNHASVTSSAATNTGAAVNANLATLNQNVGSHTHAVDVPAMTGVNSGTVSHSHADNNIYQHQHAANQTATNWTLTEVANATDLDDVTWYLMASGVSV